MKPITLDTLTLRPAFSIAGAVASPVVSSRFAGICTTLKECLPRTNDNPYAGNECFPATREQGNEPGTGAETQSTLFYCLFVGMLLNATSTLWRKSHLTLQNLQR